MIEKQAGRLNSSFFIVIAALSAALGLWLGNAYFGTRTIELQTAIAYPQPKLIPSFELIDANGASYTEKRWLGRWDLLFFGFTYCPDICPATLAHLKQASDILEDKKVSVPAVTLISVDPDRDTPAQLKSYVKYFDPNFEAATGADETLSALSRQLGIVYAVEEHKAGDQSYSVDHSASVLLINPKGELHAVFRAPHDPAKIAADLKQIIEL